MTNAPLGAFSTAALYCFFLLTFYIWMFRQLKINQLTKQNLHFGFGILLVGHMINTLGNLYVFCVDQPPITNENLEMMADSLELHIGMLSSWLPFTWLALLLDLTILLSVAYRIYGKRINNGLAIVLSFYLIAKIVLDLLILVLYSELGNTLNSPLT